MFCFLECSIHTYGLECQWICGNCRDNEPCDINNGSCKNGCERGTRGIKCDEGIFKLNTSIYIISYIITVFKTRQQFQKTLHLLSFFIKNDSTDSFVFFTNIITFIERKKYLILSTLGNLLISKSQAKFLKKSIRENVSVKLHPCI